MKKLSISILGITAALMVRICTMLIKDFHDLDH